MTANQQALRIKVCSMNSSLFRISVAQQPGACIVSLSGDLDYAASIELMPKLVEITDQCDADLLFDLSEVTLIDSEGIKALLSANARMRDKHSHVRVVNCSLAARRMLQLVGVDEALGIRAG